MGVGEDPMTCQKKNKKTKTKQGDRPGQTICRLKQKPDMDTQGGRSGENKVGDQEKNMDLCKNGILILDS